MNKLSDEAMLLLKKHIEDENKILLDTYDTDKEFNKQVNIQMKKELQYFSKLNDINSQDISTEQIEEYKNIAAEKYINYSEQYSYVIEKIKNYHRNMKINKLIQPIVDLENLIGNQCYNSNIQNYRWGEWVGDGREFKYPIKYLCRDGSLKKEKYMKKDFNADEIMSAFYPFGANDLYIGKSIFKLLDYLENRYGLNFVELEETRNRLINEEK